MPKEKQQQFAIVLQRGNGRYVKQLAEVSSKYAAKVAVRRFAEKYDHSYNIVIEDIK